MPPPPARANPDGFCLPANKMCPYELKPLCDPLARRLFLFSFRSREPADLQGFGRGGSVHGQYGAGAGAGGATRRLKLRCNSPGVNGTA